ncbi:AIR carboxylase family protein [Candidatus Woesearchaeota archaeon]|nr:AIR carboxylase family protein [Candidatus Woesearchaeota archaeon]
MKDILVLFASKSDEDSYKQVLNVLDKEKASYDFRIASAHKTPDDVDAILKNDYKVVIAGAGLSAALPGFIASKTIRAVIGVPCKGNYEGLDALLSIVQMPPGIPVLATGVNNAAGAAYAAVQMLKKNEKVVLIGDNNTKAFRNAEQILKQFEINHVHSNQLSENAINIAFVYFDEPIEKKKELAIYCPLLLEEDDKAESSLNLLKHSNHGLWVGLNNGTNAALAAIEILNIDNRYEEKLIRYRKDIAKKVKSQ